MGKKKETISEVKIQIQPKELKSKFYNTFVEMQANEIIIAVRS